MSDRLIILDTETTGFSPDNGDRVIEIGCVEVVDRKMTNQQYHCYINPEGKLVGDSINVHGISDEYLLDKPLFKDIAEAFLTWIGDSDIIAHNANFDISFLDHELKLMGHGYRLAEQNRIIDSLAIAREKHPGQRNSLDALCTRYRIDNSGRELHGALIDADLLAQVYLALTGGQFTLLGEEKRGQTSAVSQYHIALSSEQIEYYKQQLVTTKLDDAQRNAHEAYLSSIGLEPDQHW